MSKTVTHMKTLPSRYWTEKANEILQMRKSSFCWTKKNPLIFMKLFTVSILLHTVSLEGPIDNECGQCNVLCLDTSDSMWGESFRSMTNLALRFISGLGFSLVFFGFLI